MKVWNLFGCGFSALVLAAACGGSSDDGGGAAPVPRDQAPTQFINAVCDNIAPCCQKSGLPYDQQGCRATWDTIVNEQLFSFPDTTTYDAAAAGACLNLVKQAYRSCTEVPTGGPCQQVISGKVSEGGACSNSIECAAPPNGDASCQQGKCVAEPRGKSGDGCNSTCTESPGSTSCFGGTGGGPSGPATCYTNDGLACLADGKCGPVASLGQPCDFGTCAPGSYCDTTCKEPKAAGSPCASFDECVPTAYCDFQGTHNCEPKKPDGAACQDYDECSGGDCNAGKCGQDGIANPASCSGPPPKP
jgi:hypothetical protein